MSPLICRSEVGVSSVLGVGWRTNPTPTSYTENIQDFNIAMGAPKQWLWLTKYFDDRLSVKNVGPGGLARMTWKITWKFCECSKYLVKKCIALRDFQSISTSATRSSG